MKYIPVTRDAALKLNPALVARLEKEVKKSPSTQRHVAAGLDAKGNVITVACNRWDAHAEHRMIQKHFSTAKFYGKRLSAIVVVRVAQGGKWSFSMPCLKCQKLLETIGVNVMHS